MAHLVQYYDPKVSSPDPKVGRDPPGENHCGPRPSGMNPLLITFVFMILELFEEKKLGKENLTLDLVFFNSK